MTFDDTWKSLEEKDTTGKYKQAREIADLGIEQLEYAYNSGYADAKSKYERPQGELADEVWKLYKKHQSHLATHVLEFGEELKELLGKYQKEGEE